MLVYSDRTFSDQHEKLRNQTIDYMLRGKNRQKLLAKQVVDWMLKRSAANLAYNSPIGRIAVCESLVEKMGGIIEEGGPFWLVGATPRKFLHSPGRVEFEPTELKEWIARHLFGLNYIGAIEGAWIGNYTSRPYEQPMVSFHFHSLVFGAKRKIIKSVKKELAESERMSSVLDPGEGVAHYKLLQPGSEESYVRYIMKAPMKEYRLPKLKNESSREGPRTGRVWKRPLRPGAAVKMMLAIGDAGIEDYLIAGGRGVQVMEAALARAREQLSHQEAERQRRIWRAVWGH